MLESNYKKLQAQVLAQHFDANDTAFLERELTFVRAHVIETAYLPSLARGFVPKATDIPDSADTYVYKTLNVVGKAKMITYESKDLPRVDVDGLEVLGKVHPLGASWGFTINELKESARLKTNLAEAKPRAARDVVERGIDNILAFGSIPDEAGLLPDVLLQGLVNNPAVTTLGITSMPWWLNPTPMDPNLVLKSIADFATKISTRSSDTWQADTLLMPTLHYNFLQQTSYSTLTGETLLTIFKRNNPNLTTIAPWFKLNTAGAGGLPRMIAYKKDASILEGVIPQEFEVVAPQYSALEILYNCHARCGGVKIYQPLAVVYGDFLIA